MKLTTFMLLLALMQVSAKGYAQTVTLSGKDLSLSKVFKKIEKQTGYNFLYTKEQLAQSKKVKVNITDKNLKESLREVFRNQPLTFAIVKNTIVLKSKEVSQESKDGEVIEKEAVNVSGVVIDSATGEPLAGVTVRVKGSNSKGATTDGKGQFSLSEISENAILIISYLGYDQQQVHVNGRNSINIIMKPSTSGLGELVVLGFGQTEKKIAQTGSLASIGTKELVQSPVSNITNALAGRLPGLITLQQSGEPGRDYSNLYIRGRSTLNSNQPLVSIDGIQKDYKALLTLDPHAVESVTILKDASATALYGVKGANGVIIVKTRRGKTGKPVVNVSSKTAVQIPANLPEFLGSYDFARLYNEAFLNDHPGTLSLPYSDAALKAYKTHSQPLLYPDVDWLDEVLKPSVFNQTNINVSGGTEKVRYFVNLGYIYQDGLYKTQKNNQYDPEFKLNRYNLRSNVDIDVSKDFSLSLNLFGSIIDRNYPNVSSNNMFGGILTRTPPNAFPIKYPIGYWALPPTGYSNPFDRINSTGFSQEFDARLSGKLSATRKLNTITKGLSAKFNFSFDGYFINHFHRTKSVRKAVYKGFGSFDDTSSYTFRGEDIPLAAPTAQFTQNRDTWIDVSLNYHRKFGKHEVGGLLLANRQKQIRGGEIPYVSQGLVTRLTYNYANTYFFEFDAGYNGTDNFAPNHRYGFFPAVSVGWIITYDNPIVDYLKLRASYGLTGNDQLSVANRRWLFISEYQSAGGYSYGDPLAHISGIDEGPLANTYVTWEKAQRSNLGIDLSLFKNGLLKFTLDAFYEKRKDMLVLPGQIPYLSGIPSSDQPPVNFGVTENKGFEIEVSHQNKIGQVRYFIKGNMSYAKNKILEMDEESRKWPNLYKTGHSIGQEFGLKAIGFFKNQKDIITSRKQMFGQVIPGDVKYYDVNGDGVIDKNDITAIGYSNVPEIMFGLSAGFNWKDIDFSVLFQGAGNFSVIRSYDAAYEFYNGGKVMKAHLGRWTPETATTATYPALHSEFNTNNYQASTLYQDNCDYIRLKNVEVGYTFKNIRLSTKKELNNIRIFLSGENLFTWDTLEKGFDPEAKGGKYMQYPITKVFNFGISTQF